MRINTDLQNSLNFQSSFYDKFFDFIPNKDIKNPAKFNRLGRALASPHYNRLALGVAAIATQPIIDRYNPKVDLDTAKMSSYRTVAKIIACTTVGFCVRGACYKLTDKFAKASKEDGSTLLTPKAILNETNKELRNKKLKLHKNAFSTLFALGVMSITNLFLDAPLTTIFTNYLIKRDKSLATGEKTEL